jgi:hypothetical protein
VPIGRTLDGEFERATGQGVAYLLWVEISSDLHPRER